MIKTYEYRKLFRFRHTKLFDVTSQGILFEDTLYQWSEIVLIEQISRGRYDVGIIQFEDGKKCQFILNTFREKGQKNECFLGLNTHFNELKSIVYEYTVAMPRQAKYEERKQYRTFLMEQIESESDPLKKQKHINELEASRRQAIDELNSIIQICKREC